MIAKHDEEKRSRIWQIIMWVSTGLIILIVAFFLIKLFTANPLEGSWQRQDSGMFFTIEKDGEA